MDDKLKKVFADTFRLPAAEAAALNETHSINNVTNWDSLGHMKLILALEKAYGISIPDENAIELISAGKIAEFINKKAGVAARNG